jgi:hypothetical protein
VSFAFTVRVTVQLVKLVVSGSTLSIVGAVVSILDIEMPVEAIPLDVLVKSTVHDQFSVKVFEKAEPDTVHPDKSAPVWSRVTVMMTLPLVHIP